jgi:ubiquitin-protein ligase
VNKINIPSVNQGNGKVDSMNLLKQWKPETTLENILVTLKNEMMANKNKNQPADGATY